METYGNQAAESTNFHQIIYSRDETVQFLCVYV